MRPGPEVPDVGFGLTVHVDDASDSVRLVMVWRDGRPRYRVRPRGRSAAVSCPDELDPELLEFLLAWWNAFVDAGWPMDSWFLVDCPRCGAISFTPCVDQTRPGRRNRSVHRERDPTAPAARR